MHFTRREFNRLAGLAAVSTVVPALEAQSDTKRLRWCMVGLGRISMDHFMPAIRISQRASLTALVSGHRDKALKQAAMYGVPESAIYSYDNYHEIALNKEIDAVYIPQPIGMHAEYTIRAAKAAQHVLCKNTMATTIADCKAMIAACK